MILQELCEYYDILSKDSSEVPPIGYSVAKVGYVIVLTEQGQITGILDLRESSSKKLVGRSLIVPEQAGRTSGVFPYFLCDKAEYILGLEDKNFKKFNESKKYHIECLESIDSPEAKAICNFYKNHIPENAIEIINEYIAKFDKNLLFVFKLNNSTKYIHESADMKEVWEQKQPLWYECFVAACLISGETTHIAGKHPAIRNFGSQGQVYITSFNADAYKSYGKNMNAPVSVDNAFKYTSMVSYLLRSDSEQKVFLGDSTVIFWAQHPSGGYNDTFMAFLNPSAKLDINKSEEEKVNDEKQERLIKNVLSAVKAGSKLPIGDEDLEPDTNFCILALAPNNARISIRFFYKDTFGDLIKKIGQHYEDMKIVGAREHIPIWLLLSATVHERSKEKASSPLLAGKVLEAILSGGLYPTSLFSTIIERIRVEQDVDDIKASILKAYLIRKYRYEKNILKEELTVSWNDGLKDPAYLLGRLFAVLEQAQWKAHGEVNSGIKERFFASAAFSPRRIFPQLIKNAQNHLAKAEKSGWLDKMIGEILADINDFPVQLNLDKQGLFMLGYYHQRQEFFIKKEEN